MLCYLLKQAAAAAAAVKYKRGRKMPNGYRCIATEQDVEDKHDKYFTSVASARVKRCR